ncbi:hypothetical protein ASF41_22770 [Methylobacterium sp. Leaf111]|uniref:hypothetical protein n=1 Tax=Methylobacterium sp. Leaf111 TaxID=1736257 RepID=UPI0006F388BD|nr:hypothetical protein [Methylobacterium sp. Leaf111]KQP61880.1 hypothetical protein ASF41_22770 [Methylobacterium sp. Leaf111]
MHGRTGDRPLTKAEEFFQDDPAPAYDDPWAVLVQVLADALADMDEAERSSPQRNRLIPRGYIRDGAIYLGDGR